MVCRTGKCGVSSNKPLSLKFDALPGLYSLTITKLGLKHTLVRSLSCSMRVFDKHDEKLLQSYSFSFGKRGQSYYKQNVEVLEKKQCFSWPVHSLAFRFFFPFSLPLLSMS